MLPKHIHLEIRKSVFEAARSEGFRSHSLFASSGISVLPKFTNQRLAFPDALYTSPILGSAHAIESRMPWRTVALDVQYRCMRPAEHPASFQRGPLIPKISFRA
jgi:hypothetical protein